MGRRGGLLLWSLGSAFPASSSCRGLDLLSCILCSWMVLYGLGRPGKLLLPGSCLLGPASSSCRGPCLECLVFSWFFLGGPCRRVLQLPVHKSGVLRYPYFSTPTHCRQCHLKIDTERLDSHFMDCRKVVPYYLLANTRCFIALVLLY